jgi:hypothetical protein
MITLVALMVMAMAFLSMAAMEPQISTNLNDAARARYVAEAGVEWAFQTLAATQSWSTVLEGNLAAGMTMTGLTAASGTFTVVVRNDNQAGDTAFTGQAADPGLAGNTAIDSNNILIVTATGNFGTASRQVQAAIKRDGLPPFPGAVNVPGFQADTFLSSGINATNASNYDIDGRDYTCTANCSDANPDNWTWSATSNPMKLGIQVQPGTQTDISMTYEARVEQPFDNQNICTGGDCSSPTKAANRTARLNIVKGMNQSTAPPLSTGTPTTGVNTIGADAALNPQVMSGFLTQVASNKATTIVQSKQACPLVLTGSSTPNQPTLTTSAASSSGCAPGTPLGEPLDLGTTTNPKLVYFRGDPDTSSLFAGLTMKETVRGAGILVIEDGDFQQYSNFRWDGIVIVTGKYVSAALRTGGNTRIYGALVAMESVPTEAGGFYDFYIDKGANVRVRASKRNLDMAQLLLALHKILSWREL